MVAVNKIDKEGAQPERVRTEMTQHGLQPAEWGGEIEFVDVSAKTREGLGLAARHDPGRHRPRGAEGQQRRRGLGHRDRVQARPRPRAGRERPDPARNAARRRRARRRRALRPRSRDARLHRRRVKGATPGQPVEVLGFDGVPEAGETRARGRERASRPPARRRAREPPEDRGAGAALGAQDLAGGRLQARPGGHGQGARPGRQGRCRRLAGGDRGRDRQAAPGRGQGQHHPSRRRWHQRVRRDARCRLQRA